MFGILIQPEWSTVGLTQVIVFAVMGILINIYFAVATKKSMRHRLGNVFLCFSSMVDIFFTVLVVFITATMMYARQLRDLRTCHLLQFITEACNYTYSLFFFLLSYGDYYHYCHSMLIYSDARIANITTSVLAVTCITAAIGTHFELDYDYCERRHFGNIYFRVATTFVFYVIPGIGTMYYLITNCVSMWSWRYGCMFYRVRRSYSKDFRTTILNTMAYLLLIILWMPYLILVNFAPDVDDPTYYFYAWLGCSRPLFSIPFYLCMDIIISLLSFLGIFCCTIPDVVICDEPPAVVNTTAIEMTPVCPESEGEPTLLETEL